MSLNYHGITLWLTPSSTEFSNRFADLIKDCAQKYQLISFVPHVTIASGGDTWPLSSVLIDGQVDSTKISELIEIIRIGCRNYSTRYPSTKAIELIPTGIKTNLIPFQYVFVELELTESLKCLNKSLMDALNGAGDRKPFYPHASIVYSTENEKAQSIIDEIDTEHVHKDGDEFKSFLGARSWSSSNITVVVANGPSDSWKVVAEVPIYE